MKTVLSDIVIRELSPTQKEIVIKFTDGYGLSAKIDQFADIHEVSGILRALAQEIDATYLKALEK